MKQQLKNLLLRLLASLNVPPSTMPLLSQAVRQQNYRTLIEVNGVLLERQVEPERPVSIAMNAEVPIRTASVLHEDVHCFFIRRLWYYNRSDDFPMAQLPDGTLTQSTVSPVFGRNYDLALTDQEHYYTSLSCYSNVNNALTILLEVFVPSSSTFTSAIFVMESGDKRQFEMFLPDGGISNVLKATLLESPYPSMRCKVGMRGDDDNSVEIKLGQPYETNIAQVQYIECRRN